VDFVFVQLQLLTLKVLKQIKQTEGAINYAVKADFLRKRFWTASVWKNRYSLRSFMTAEPHATAVKNFFEWSGGGSAFVEWTDQSTSIDWTFALKKLQNPTYYYKKDKD
jgi:hypothetical protein